MTCPICKNKDTIVYEDYVSSTLCEDIEECKNCGYSYEYLYGFTRITYGNFFYLEYGYTDPDVVAKYKSYLKNKYDFWYKYLWRLSPIFYFISGKYK